MGVQEGALLCGRYRLQRSIGRGGMADVHLAFDEKRQAPVAVKILREDMAEDPDFVRRFRREAEALARLDHPNIVRFYAFEQDGPIAFIVMDYIDGSTLRRYLHDRRSPLELTEITPILRDVCSALHYAHLNGFVHRDLKPGNVMLRPDARALLTDFGISRALEGSTATNAVMGTPAYMSPEQIAGGQVNARSDIYSLGALLFEMATGRRPFTGDEPGLTQTGTNTRIQEAHLRLPPPDPRTLNPGLPPAAAAVILRTLAKDPADRWPDVVSLRQAWEAAAGAPITPAADAAVGSRTPARKTRAVRPSRTGRGLPRWVPILAGVVFVAVAAALVIASRPTGGTPAVAPATAAARAAATAHASAIVMPSAVPPPTALTQPVKGGVQVVTRSPIGRAASATGAPLPVATKAPAGETLAPDQPTIVPTATVRPSVAPRTPTPRPATAPATATKAPSITGGVELVNPSHGDRIIGSAVFRWRNQGNFELKAGEHYELIIWRIGEDPLRDGRSPVGAGDATRVEANLAGVEAVLRIASGNLYYWGVRLWQDGVGPVRMLSDGRRFIYEAPGDRTFTSPVKPPGP